MELVDHLAHVYGIAVVHTEPLCRANNVLRVDHADGQQWVARVFGGRSAEAVEGDAAVLHHLEQQGYPAERCATPAPVSTLDDQPILVTRFIAGPQQAPTVEGSFVQGDLLGRLHALDIPAGTRDGTAWHTLSPNGGGRRADAATLLSLLADARERAPAELRWVHDSLREELDQVDYCVDLPHALIHPDFADVNIVVSPTAGPVAIDWTGTGIGPRIQSLGMALRRGGMGMEHVDAVVAGYSQHITLDDEELVRLAPAIRLPGLILNGWYAAHVPRVLAETGEDLEPDRTEAEAIAQRVRAIVKK